jgi:hypothetical protein
MKQIVAYLIFVIILTLSLLAFLGWKRQKREGLPKWRQIAGISSITIVFLDCLGVVFLILSSGSSNFDSFAEFLAGALPISSLASFLLALALKGAPRVEALVASLVMTVVLLTSGVH